MLFRSRTLEGMEEERRLAFVAMTRAQKRLFISEAGGRNFEGIPRYPSRFILDIDEGKLEYTEKPDETMLKAVRKFIENDSRHLKGAMKLSTIEPGSRVEHAIFGVGTILEVDYEEESYLVKFDEMETPRKISYKIRLKKLD